jgi:hypothetical protein
MPGWSSAASVRPDLASRGAGKEPHSPARRLEIFEPWVPALAGSTTNLEVDFGWAALSRRDLVLQSPKNNKSTRGTFSLRRHSGQTRWAPRRQAGRH